MKTLNITLVLLALTLAGCTTFTVLNDASNWTIELASSEPSPSGSCKVYDDLGRLMLEGMLSAGKMDGTWTSFSSQGVRLPLLRWAYRDGARNGPVQMWYGPLAYPEASGHLNTEGTFLDGVYDGTVTTYYPSGTKISVRIYDHGTLKSCQYWSPEGVEHSSAEAVAEANRETQSDLRYITSEEDSVTRALAQAHRRIQK
jgi:hypothetical protein